MSSFPPCPLLSLPLELVFLITGYINVRSFAFLARTCRAMQALLCPDLDLYFETNIEELLYWAARNNRPYTLQRAFLIRAAYPGDWSEGKASLLFEAIAMHSSDAVCTLLANHVHPDEPSGDPWLLSVAVQERDIEVVQMLLQAGANPNRDLGFGRSPMELAKYYGRLDIMDLLLMYGADLPIDSESSSCSCGSWQDDKSDSSSCGSGHDDESDSSCGSGQDDESDSSSCGSGHGDESDSSSCGRGQGYESDSD